jgi:hypothetical protein
MGAQNALTPIKTMKKPIASSHGQSNAAVLPCGPDRLALYKSLDEPGQLPGGKTSVHKRIAQANARRPSASFAVRTVRIAEYPPCPDALFALGYVSANAAMTDQRALCAAERTAQRVQQFQKQFNGLSALEKSLHPQEDTEGHDLTKMEQARDPIRWVGNKSPRGGTAALQQSRSFPNSSLLHHNLN